MKTRGYIKNRHGDTRALEIDAQETMRGDVTPQQERRLEEPVGKETKNPRIRHREIRRSTILKRWR